MVDGFLLPFIVCATNTLSIILNLLYADILVGSSLSRDEMIGSFNIKAPQSRKDPRRLFPMHDWLKVS